MFRFRSADFKRFSAESGTLYFSASGSGRDRGVGSVRARGGVDLAFRRPPRPEIDPKMANCGFRQSGAQPAGDS